jgi:hypothetical protein
VVHTLGGLQAGASVRRFRAAASAKSGNSTLGEDFLIVSSPENAFGQLVKNGELRSANDDRS